VTGSYSNPNGESVEAGAGPVGARSTSKAHTFPGAGGAVGLLAILFTLNILVGLLIVVGAGGVDKIELPAYQLALGYVLSFGVTLWLGIRMSRSTLREVMRPRSFPGSALVPMIAVLFGLWVLLIQSMAFMTRAVPVDRSMMEEMSRILFESLWIGVPLLVIAAPVLEEALFRGVILRGFLERYKPWKAVVLSAVLFSVAHFNVWQLPASFAVGVFMGWVYYRTRSLLLCILLHAFHNLTLAFVGQYVASLFGISPDETVVPFIPWWVVAVGVVFLFAGVYLAEKRLGGRPEEIRSDWNVPADPEFP
jgi:membrane protease YdiL (CAAX protease family)